MQQEKGINNKAVDMAGAGVYGAVEFGKDTAEAALKMAGRATVDRLTLQ